MSNVVWKNSERDWRQKTASFLKGGVAMAELEFERRLERLFMDSPELADAGAFAERVERRLDAGWTARRWLIGASGVVGGSIGAYQLMVSGTLPAGGDGGRFRALPVHQPQSPFHQHRLDHRDLQRRGCGVGENRRPGGAGGRQRGHGAAWPAQHRRRDAGDDDPAWAGSGARLVKRALVVVDHAVRDATRARRRQAYAGGRCPGHEGNRVPGGQDRGWARHMAGTDRATWCSAACR